MLRRRRIKFYTSENEDLKASVVERFNRTLKTKMKMYRYFTHANTRRYFDVLDDLLTRRATGRKRFLRSSRVFPRLRWRTNWEIWPANLQKANSTNDSMNPKSKKWQNPTESTSTSTAYSRLGKLGGKIQYLVPWNGYPSKFNSWVDEIVPRRIDFTWLYRLTARRSTIPRTRGPVTRRNSKIKSNSRTSGRWVWRRYRFLSKWKTWYYGQCYFDLYINDVHVRWVTLPSGHHKRVRSLIDTIHREQHSQIPLQSHEPLIVEFSYVNSKILILQSRLASRAGFRRIREVSMQHNGKTFDVSDRGGR